MLAVTRLLTDSRAKASASPQQSTGRLRGEPSAAVLASPLEGVGLERLDVQRPDLGELEPPERGSKLDGVPAVVEPDPMRERDQRGQLIERQVCDGARLVAGASPLRISC